MARQKNAPAAATVLITGSNRGLGFEFSRQYAAKGWKVIATCRNPESADDLNSVAGSYPALAVERLDVMNHRQVDALAQRYLGTPIDLLINNAGISGGFEHQVFGGIRYDHFGDVCATNFIAPLKIAETFIEHVAASTQKKIMNISSMPSSISLSSGGQYIDRPSKAALNMVMRTLAKDTAVRGIVVGLLAPGLVDTDLTRELDFPKISPEESVSMLIDLIERFTPEMSGCLIQHTGEILPW